MLDEPGAVPVMCVMAGSVVSVAGEWLKQMERRVKILMSALCSLTSVRAECVSTWREASSALVQMVSLSTPQEMMIVF